MVARQVIQKAPLSIFGCTQIHCFSVIMTVGALPYRLPLALLAPPLMPERGFFAFAIL
jgi:hypothetical protein